MTNNQVPEEVMDFVMHMKYKEDGEKADSEVRVFKNLNTTQKTFNDWVSSLTNQDASNNPNAVLHLRAADLNYISGLVQSAIEDSKSYIRGRMLEILEEGLNE